MRRLSQLNASMKFHIHLIFCPPHLQYTQAHLGMAYSKEFWDEHQILILDEHQILIWEEHLGRTYVPTMEKPLIEVDAPPKK